MVGKGELKRDCFPTPESTLTRMCSKPNIFTAQGPYTDQDSMTVVRAVPHISQKKHAALRNSWFASTCAAWKVQEATSPRQGRQQPLRPPSHKEKHPAHMLYPGPLSQDTPLPRKPLALNERQYGQDAEACSFGPWGTHFATCSKATASQHCTVGCMLEMRSFTPWPQPA